MFLPAPVLYSAKEIADCLRFCTIIKEGHPSVWPCLVFDKVIQMDDMLKRLGMENKDLEQALWELQLPKNEGIVLLLGENSPYDPPVLAAQDLVRPEPFSRCMLSDEARNHRDNAHFCQAMSVALWIYRRDDAATVSDFSRLHPKNTNRQSNDGSSSQPNASSTGESQSMLDSKHPALPTNKEAAKETTTDDDVPMQDDDSPVLAARADHETPINQSAAQAKATKPSPTPVNRRSASRSTTRTSKSTKATKSSAPQARDTRSQSNKSANRELESPLDRKRKPASKSPPSSKKKKRIELEQVEIPTNGQIQKLLKLGGYKFTKSGCYRPGSKMVYTVNELRQDLCQFGVNCQCGGTPGYDQPCDCWDTDQKFDIHCWVRYNVFHDTPPAQGIISISQREALQLLLRLGFKYNSKRNNYLMFPHTKDADLVDGKNLFKDSARIIKHLARVGLPDNCDFDELTKDERFSLEYVMAVPDDGLDSFGRLDEVDGEDSPIKFLDKNSPVTRRATRARMSHLIDDNATVVTNASSQSSVFSQASTTHSRRTNASPKKAAPTFDATSAFSPSPVKLDAVRVSESPRKLVRNTPVPKFSGTDEEKLQACLESLNSDDHALDLFVGDRSSPNLKAIMTFMLNAIDSNGARGGENGTAALYVCGAPGVGKTCGVKWAFEKARDQSQHSSEPVMCFLNCGHILADKNPSKKIWSELGACLGMKSKQRSETAVCTKLDANNGSTAKSGVLILVLDEIECFLSGDKKRDMLERLMCMANDSNTRMALIGISNSMNDENVEKIKETGDFLDTITFSSYGESEVEDILKRRVGTAVFDASVLSMIAKKNAKASGDVRNALEMASNAIQHRLNNCDNSRFTKGYLITTKDAFLGNKDAVTLQGTITGLSMAGQCLLCILTSFSKAGVMSSTVGTLKRNVDDCLRMAGNESETLQYDDFIVMLETLVDNGLLRASSSEHGFLLNKSMRDAFTEPISLGVQNEEVEKVLEKSLTQSYFVRIREYALEQGRGIQHI